MKSPVGVALGLFKEAAGLNFEKEIQPESLILSRAHRKIINLVPGFPGTSIATLRA
jgi:hypothetical protein